MSEEVPTPNLPKKPTTEEMMAENLELTKEMHAMMIKVRRYMAVRAIMGVVYLVLILAPIILAFIYLPPLIEPAVEQYQSLFNVSGGFNASDLLRLYQGE